MPNILQRIPLVVLKLSSLTLLCLAIWRGTEFTKLPDQGQLLADLKALELQQLKLKRPREKIELTELPHLKLILDAELFGSLPKPAPELAEASPPTPVLTGVAGQSAIFSLGDKKTYLIAVGKEKDGIKLLKLAINRALIEYLGETMELTIYSGFGSDSLIDGPVAELIDTGSPQSTTEINSKLPSNETMPNTEVNNQSPQKEDGNHGS